MRVIEPRYKQRNKHKNRKPIVVVLFTFVIISITSSYIFYVYQNKSVKNGDINHNAEVLAEQRSQKQIINPKDVDFKYFGGDEFQKLYDKIAYPNTQALFTPPSITGDTAADNRIRLVATSRGYTLRSVPVSPIDKTDVPGLIGDDLLQPLALTAWQKLKNIADTDGIPLKLNSGYRSIEMQRQLFVSRLRATGATNAQIANGQADNQIVAVLSQAAIPGYSRHHTGFTVDFVCANGTQSFETTTCFKWLHENNYLNAKKYGWIPSYPDGVNSQGPEPEPWEFVWVGVQSLLKDQ